MKRVGLVIGGLVVVSVVLWHLSIESSIAIKGDEPSPFGWFFLSAVGLTALALG